MKTIHKLAIGVLLAAFFSVGYLARHDVDRRDRAFAERHSNSVLVVSPGARVASINLEGAAEVDFRPLQTLLNVLTNLRQYYVDRITPEDEGKMTYEALRAMLRSLNDPNTRFIEPADRKVLADAQEGIFHGIGAVLGIKRIHTGEYVEADSTDEELDLLPGVRPKPRGKKEIIDEHLVVIAVLPGSPAYEAGLCAGDDITAINSKQVLPFDPYQKIAKILKEARSATISERVRIRKVLEAEQKRLEDGIGILDALNLLMRGDEKPFELTVAKTGAEEPAKVKVDSREFSLEPVTAGPLENGRYGYVKLNLLGPKTSDAFDAAIADLNKSVAGGMVLDLRGVAGGGLEPARHIGSWFVPGKPLAIEQKSRGRKSTITIPDRAEGVWKQPLVVLVDKSTARTAEILAAALRENGAAKLVGEKTYGDMAVTTVYEQADGSAVMLSTGALLTGKGGAYAGKGIPVDVEIASGASGDAALDAALKLLNASRKEARAR